MSRLVRISGDVAVYPAGACVSCLRPTTHEIEIAKVKRHAVRKIRVPFCRECSDLRQHKSSRQVLFERIATVNSLLLALTVGLYTYVRISDMVRARVSVAMPGQEMGGAGSGRAAYGWAWLATQYGLWALLLGALSALVVFGLMYLLVEPWARHFRSIATTNALRAVTIKDFDWETTTLEFWDEEYAEQFARANGL